MTDVRSQPRPSYDWSHPPPLSHLSCTPRNPTHLDRVKRKQTERDFLIYRCEGRTPLITRGRSWSVTLLFITLGSMVRPPFVFSLSSTFVTIQYPRCPTHSRVLEYDNPLSVPRISLVLPFLSPIRPYPEAGSLTDTPLISPSSPTDDPMCKKKEIYPRVLLKECFVVMYLRSGRWRVFPIQKLVPFRGVWVDSLVLYGTHLYGVFMG